MLIDDAGRARARGGRAEMLRAIAAMPCPAFALCAPRPWRIASASAAQQRLWGLDGGPLGLPLSAVPGSGALLRALERAGDGGTATVPMPIAGRSLEVSLGPWPADGPAELVLGICHDATDHLRRAERAEEEAATLGRLASEVRLFASIAAHDVRSPLATIEGLADVLADGFIDMGDGKLALIKGAARTAESARRQMDELLRHANALDLRPEPPCALRLEEEVRQIERLIGPGRARIDCTPLRLAAERVPLRIVLRNLVGNAVRHCAGRVEVRGTLGGGWLDLSVLDDGPGFPEGLDPFADPDTGRRDRTATGFGLVAVRHLATARGGEVGIVRNGRPGGARVTFPASGP